MNKLALLLLLIAAPFLAQSQRPSFEAASIKPYTPPADGPHFFGFRNSPGGRLTVTGATLKMLMTYGYRIRDFQVIGGPDWINTDRFDIVAKAEDGAVPVNARTDMTKIDPVALMMQSLIDERFQLKMHRETRELPVYELVAVKGGAKLQLSEDQSSPKPPEPGAAPPPPPPPGPRGGMPPAPGRGGLFMMGSPNGMVLQGTAVTLPNFIQVLSQQMGRPVIDKTDLKPGLYDFKLQFTPDSMGGGGGLGPPPGAALPPGAEKAPPAEPLGPTIFSALQEQLGLRLVSAKGPVEVFVIDSAQKPAE